MSVFGIKSLKLTFNSKLSSHSVLSGHVSTLLWFVKHFLSHRVSGKRVGKGDNMDGSGITVFPGSN